MNGEMDMYTPQGGYRAGGSFREFAASVPGRITVIGAALMSLLIIGGMVAMFIAASATAPSGDDIGIGTLPPTSDGMPTPAEPADDAPTSDTDADDGTGDDAENLAAPISNADVFSFRDPFEPLLKKIVAPSTDSSPTLPGTTPTTTVPGDDPDRDPDELLLQDIVIEDGQRTAVLFLGSTEYRLTEGEQVGTTPWSVLDIRESSVVMLYGDDPITLTVGQGIVK